MWRIKRVTLREMDSFADSWSSPSPPLKRRFSLHLDFQFQTVFSFSGHPSRPASSLNSLVGVSLPFVHSTRYLSFPLSPLLLLLLQPAAAIFPSLTRITAGLPAGYIHCWSHFCASSLSEERKRPMTGNCAFIWHPCPPPPPSFESSFSFLSLT
jgi:hypothetical protein